MKLIILSPHHEVEKSKNRKNTIYSVKSIILTPHQEVKRRKNPIYSIKSMILPSHHFTNSSKSQNVKKFQYNLHVLLPLHVLSDYLPYLKNHRYIRNSEDSLLKEKRQNNLTIFKFPPLKNEGRQNEHNIVNFRNENRRPNLKYRRQNRLHISFSVKGG